MKPVTSQDMKWTRLQNDPRTEALSRKVLGTWRFTNEINSAGEIFSHPKKHDLSVQIRRLKWPLMATIWLSKLWDSTIASIWTYGRPNSSQGARRYGPRNASCTDKSKIRQIIFRGCFGILSSFSVKPMNTKVGDNFLAHNLDTEFALFGFRMWEIWHLQGWAVN
jgi:hypothetical protein